MPAVLQAAYQCSAALASPALAAASTSALRVSVFGRRLASTPRLKCSSAASRLPAFAAALTRTVKLTVSSDTPLACAVPCQRSAEVRSPLLAAAAMMLVISSRFGRIPARVACSIQNSAAVKLLLFAAASIRQLSDKAHGARRALSISPNQCSAACKSPPVAAASIIMMYDTRSCPNNLARTLSQRPATSRSPALAPDSIIFPIPFALSSIPFFNISRRYSSALACLPAFAQAFSSVFHITRRSSGANKSAEDSICRSTASAASTSPTSAYALTSSNRANTLFLSKI
mmetsp:Transcript_19003/g.59637  ORF Transcript_19003/g.59637 Transcript_19003/m.59637 type:complete len:287 (-) Transcript_19003:256-1116(-)